MNLRRQHPRKNLYLTILSMGFVWTLFFLMLPAGHVSLGPQPISVNETAWIFWAMSFAFSPLIALFSFRLALSKWRSGERNKNILLLVKHGLHFIFMLVMSSIVHTFIGLFMSVLLPIEPAQQFGPNGFINHFEWTQVLELLSRHPELFVGFLALKSSALIVKKEELLGGHTLVQHGVLSLVFGAIARLADHFFPLGIFIFAGLQFFPWPLIVDKDIHGKARAKEADLSPDPVLPIEFIDRASSFWGMVVAGFGSIFLLIAPVFLFQMIHKQQLVDAGSIFFGILFLLAFAGFGGLAVLIGCTMIFGYSKVLINSDSVHVESRFRDSIFRKRFWSEPRSRYHLEKITEVHRDSDGPDYTSFTIEYRHASDTKRNVILYRSYHAEGLEEKFKAWQRALGGS